MNEIENWYDNKYDEWSRLDRHRIEFEITKMYLDEYITGTGLKILDVGGGPGRYSFYMAGKGHSVTLLDLSGHNIEVAKEKAAEFGISLADYIKGDALELDMREKKYDAVLLMGPLYHLIREDDRIKALGNAIRVLKSGGIIVASFISQYAPIQDALAHMQFEGYPGEVEALLGYLSNGENKDGNGFTTAYFTGVDEARKLMSVFELHELAFAGIENILGSKECEILSLPEKDIDKWLKIGYALSQDKNLIGTSQHFLYIGRK